MVVRINKLTLAVNAERACGAQIAHDQEVWRFRRHMMKNCLFATVCAFAVAAPGIAQAVSTDEAQTATLKLCENVGRSLIGMSTEQLACANGYLSTHWVSDTSADELDNSKLTQIWTTSPKMIDNSINRPAQVVLFVRCNKDTTELVVRWPKVIGSSMEKAEIKWRIDDSKISTEHWPVATNMQAVFANKPVDLLKAMIGKKEFVVNVPTFQAGPQTVTFNLDGLEDALKPVREQCKW